MQVFKAFMKIAKKKLPSVSIYFIIFSVLTFLLSGSASKDNTFEASRLDICIINEDNTKSSEQLIEYLSTNNEIVDMDTDTESLQDALYYHQIDYVLTIKEGYEEKLAKGETDDLFENIKRPGTYAGQFVDNQLDQYVKTVSMYIEGGYDFEKAGEEALRVSKLEVEVTKEDFSDGDSDFSENIMYFFQYLPYIFISILVAGLCPVLVTVNKKNIRNRTNCSPIPSTSSTLQIFLGSILFVLGMWIVFMILGTIAYGSDMFSSYGLLAMLNSLIFVLVATGITLLVASFAPKANAIDMISNTIGLGMSFLCGVFVPQYLLSEGVLRVSKFLPAYWYVKANNSLGGVGGEVFEMSNYLKYLGVEALFAVALLSVTMLIMKTKSKGSDSL